MMKAAGEGPAPAAIMPGQARGRLAHKGQAVGKDQLLADFDRLLAKQSAIADNLPVSEEPQPDDKAAAPDAAFLSIASLGDLVSRLAAALPQAKLQAEDTAPPAQAAEADILSTDIADEAEMPADPAPRQIARGASAQRPPAVTPEPAPIAADAEIKDVPAHVMPAAPEAASAELSPESVRETAPPPTVTVTVKQETYFAPVQIILLGDQGPTAAPVSGLQSSTPSAPAPLVMSQPAAAPLKLLKLELGTSELGPVSATMAVKNDALDLRIKAHKDDAVASIRENAGKLTDALQSLGFSVDSITVQKINAPDASTSFNQGQASANGAPGQGGNNQAQGGSSSPEAGAGGSSRQSRHTPNGGHFAEHDGNDETRNSGGARSGSDVFV